jgi:alpha-tubulin suppressor-like RCC1 family protein
VTCYGCEKEPFEVREPQDAVDISAGGAGKCAVSASGRLYCARIGGGLLKVAGVEDVVGVSVGETHTCILKKTGVVQCSGSNADGQLGFIDLAMPKAGFEDVPDILDGAVVKTGRFHTCVLRKTGHVACFGRVGQGWLGIGPEPSERALRTRPGVVVEVKGLEDAIDLAEGGACAIRKGGAAYCWGENIHGAVGDGTLEDALVPVPVKGLSSVSQVARGRKSSCAVDLNGDLQCWGDLPKYEPKRVLGLTDAMAISLTANSAYAVRRNGSIVSWGRDERTPYVRGKEARSTAQPEARYDLTDVTAITAHNGDHKTYDACALRGAGEVVCLELSLVFRPGISDATSIALGALAGCAVRKSGAVSCWGMNAFGECGPGGDDVAAKKAVDMPIQDAVAVAAGAHTMCALRSGGGVVCWGSNLNGLLGNGTKNDNVKYGVPVPVSNLTDAVSLAMSGAQACAVRKGGQVVCWGKNERHLVDSDARELVEPTNAHISDAISLVAAETGFCAARSNGKTTCWGVGGWLLAGVAPDDDGQSDLPISDVTALSFGKAFGCAVQKSGQPWCWGEEEHGEVGAGDGRVLVKFPHP